MAVTSTPIYPQVNSSGFLSIGNADASTQKTIYVGGANGSQVTHVNVTNNDVTARDLQLSILIAGTNFIVSTVTIPLSAGNTNAAPAIAFFRSTQIPGMSLDSNGNPFLYLPSGATLQGKTLTTVGANSSVFVIAQVGDY